MGAIKRFVLPRLDYSMMNILRGVPELGELDKFTRHIINEMIG
jgi:hypothetical protein